MPCSFECELRGAIEVPYRGGLTSLILIVGESPGATEERLRQPFVGPTGELLDKCLLKAHINTDAVYYSNSARCRLHKETLSVKSINKILLNCRPHLERAIHKIRPKVIVLLGDIALQQVGKLKGITKSRGNFIWSDEFGCWLFPTYHPAYILRKPQALPILQEDFSRLQNAIEREFNFEDQKTDFSLSETSTIYDILESPPDMIALDTETQGLDWMSPNSVLISYSIAVSPTEAYQVYIHEQSDSTSDPFLYWVNKKERGVIHYKKAEHFDLKLAELKLLLEHTKIKKYMMNGNFDLHHISALYRRYDLPIPKIQNYKMDIQAAAHVLDENMYGRCSLETLRKSFTNILDNYSNEFDETYDKSNMLSVPQDKLTYYACMDAIVTYQAAVSIRSRMLKDKRLVRYFSRFVMPAISKSLLTLEENGVMLDLEQLPVAKRHISDMVDHYHSEALKYIPKGVIETHEGKEITLRRNFLIRDVLFSDKGYGLKPPKQTKKGALSTDNETRIKLDGLRLPEKARAFLDAYNSWTKYNKLLTTYIPGLAESVKDDGRIHPTLSVVTTVTGRTSSQRPNLQNIPKRGELAPHIRKLLIASPGKIFMAFDASQSELRLMGDASKDPTMLEIYNTGGDIHATTALSVLRKTRDEVSDKEFKEARRNAKVTNFSFLYGGSAYGFKRTAKTDYGLDFTDDEANRYRDRFFNTYPGVARYHSETLTFCRKYGYVISQLGRMRRLPEIHSPDKSVSGHAERQSLNHAIQSISSDLLLMALNSLLSKNLLDFNEILAILSIHDEIIFEVVDDPQILEKYYRIIKYEMEHPPLKELFGFELSVPLVAECKRGYNLNDMEDYVIGSE